jgi:hypothetical protein
MSTKRVVWLSARRSPPRLHGLAVYVATNRDDRTVCLILTIGPLTVFVRPHLSADTGEPSEP